jgi:hypothetical protein
MSHTITNAIEPWVADAVHRLQLQQHAMALQQARVHQADVHSFDVALGVHMQRIQQMAQHDMVSRQHVDVDV